jgi:uncharacterized protein (DUF983 family)
MNPARKVIPIRPMPVRAPLLSVAAVTVPQYHHGEPNRCPGCGGQSFHLGRFSAECARCGVPMPFANAGEKG